MKQVSKWIVAATLFCGLFTLTSCWEETDNPVIDGDGCGGGDDGSEYVIQNRDIILSHIKSDAGVLADNMNPEMFYLTKEVYSQLMALMVKDRNYMKNMKQILAIMAANNALKNIKLVPKDSELAKMGYLMYIPVDIQTFGVQVVFDENGSSRLFPCEGLEFIFPATVEGLGTTLYKIAFKAGSNWKETIAPAQLKNLKGLACVYRFPETLTMTLSGLFDNNVLTLSKTSFDIGETQISGQASTSLKGNGYGLPDVESTLDFKFCTEQAGKMKIDCSYVNNGLNVMTLGAMLTLPESDKLTELLSNIDFNGISIDDFNMLILDDLNLYGSIRNGDVQGYLISQEAFYPLEFRMKAEWGSYENQVMPAIWSFEHLAFVPLSELMGKTDMDNVMKVIGSVMPSMNNNTLTSVQMFSRIMQMLPLNSAEWGL